MPPGAPHPVPVGARLGSLHRRADPVPHPDISAQIEIFLKRARILRLSIGAAIICVLLASVIVLLVFAIAVLDWPVHLLVLQFFALSLLSLISSLILFLCDMHLSLRAMTELLKPHGRNQKTAGPAR